MAAIINIYITYAFSFIILLIWLFLMFSKKNIIVTNFFLWVLVGALILSIPLLYTQPLRFTNALWRVLGLFIGVFYLLSLQQLNYRKFSILSVIFFFVFILIIEISIAYQQVFSPSSSFIPLYGNRIYGTFFQPNVFASFIATGLVVTLTLLLSPGFYNFHNGVLILREAFLGMLIILTLSLLVIVQSRTGWVGAFLATVFVLFFYGKVNKIKTIIAVASIFVGVMLGVGCVFFSDLPTMIIRQDNTNNSRFNIFINTVNMIIEKPISGWGYGGFEYDLPHFRISQYPLKEITEITKHPHNEILLWVVEGGIVGIVGVSIILIGFCILFLRVKKNKYFFKDYNHDVKAFFIIVIPISLHLQLEFPFYMSPLHFIFFIVFISMVDRLSVDVTCCYKCPLIITRIMFLVSFVFFVMAGYYLSGVMALSKVEEFKMEDVSELKSMPEISRLLHWEKVGFYEHVNYLLKYNLTQDELLLEEYSKWARSYLMVHVDKNVYASLISILEHQKKINEAKEYRRKAELFYPSVKKFSSVDVNEKD